MEKASLCAQLKEEVNNNIDSIRDELIQLSLKIHDNPELGFEEHKASRWLSEYLENNGFRIESGIGGLSTAFKAIYGSGKPVIALIAEYDALPDVGHSCGHNIIGTSAIGAGVACRSAVDSLGGSVVIFGTPAEEIYGGKVTMSDAGAFNGVDIAMLVHPGVRNTVIVESLTCQNLDVEFFGKSAHAGAHPEQGVNALEAMVLSFNSLNSLRQHLKEKSRIHGIITHGGRAANIVPDYSSASLMVRSAEKNYLEEMKPKVLDCFRGAALSTGCRLEYKWGNTVYNPMKNNVLLAQLFSMNFEFLGLKVESFEHHFGFGSTDMGNVSQLVPSIHPLVAIAPLGTSLHSAEFAQAAASESGHRGLIDAAKAMSMTIVDLISDVELVNKIKMEFEDSPD
jgi:amidohydrolase